MDWNALHQVKIMTKVYRPTYVKNFQCDGKVCDSRCCHDWNVVIDDETREKYLRLPKDDREEFFQHATAFDDAQVIQMMPSGECPFLDENFLCRLQLKHGENFLTNVCQSFPRVTYKLGDEIFLQSMTLTCPVAAIEILLRGPIKFETVKKIGARMIFDYTTKLSMPVEKFLHEQRAAIKILQRRDLTINERLRRLCEHFGEKISVPVDFDEVGNSSALAEIFSETYDANLPVAKKNKLAEIFLFARKNILRQLYETFAPVLENYLVNEFFLRLYPCAFVGDKKFNVRVFVTAYRALEFAAILTTLSRKHLDIEKFFELICFLSDKFDHSRGGMNAIKNFAELHDAEVFYSLMIED
ncbi:MAG: flagellin lysine-N-methylase [Selenomonadaceae bacterium]|nr:flagellin lysine-N-methylase [Selenomonadaceae bacterium]